MVNDWQKHREHVATLSKTPTLSLTCPTCGMPAGARCVAKRKKGFGEPKYTSLHRTRNERELYEQDYLAKMQRENQQRLERRRREQRIAEGLSPEPHDEFCVCDEECYPRRLEEVEFELQWAQEQLDKAQQGMTLAQDNASKLDALQARWQIEHR